jgi:hypothetical protein
MEHTIDPALPTFVRYKAGQKNIKGGTKKIVFPKLSKISKGFLTT